MLHPPDENLKPFTKRSSDDIVGRVHPPDVNLIKHFTQRSLDDKYINGLLQGN